jgi:hypothetical protein
LAGGSVTGGTSTGVGTGGTSGGIGVGSGVCARLIIAANARALSNQRKLERRRLERSRALWAMSANSRTAPAARAVMRGKLRS